MFRRWETIKAKGRLPVGAGQAGDAVTAATRKVAEANTIRAETAASLPSLRDESKAAAELQRLTLARAELDNEERRSLRRKEAELRLRQINDDGTRAMLSADAEEALERLDGEHAGIVAACAGEARAQAEAGEALDEINRAADALKQNFPG